MLQRLYCTHPHAVCMIRFDFILMSSKRIAEENVFTSPSKFSLSKLKGVSIAYKVEKVSRQSWDSFRFRDFIMEAALKRVLSKLKRQTVYFHFQNWTLSGTRASFFKTSKAGVKPGPFSTSYCSSYLWFIVIPSLRWVFLIMFLTFDHIYIYIYMFRVFNDCAPCVMPFAGSTVAAAENFPFCTIEPNVVKAHLWTSHWEQRDVTAFDWFCGILGTSSGSKNTWCPIGDSCTSPQLHWFNSLLVLQ